MYIDPFQFFISAYYLSAAPQDNFIHVGLWDKIHIDPLRMTSKSSLVPTEGKGGERLTGPHRGMRRGRGGGGLLVPTEVWEEGGEVYNFLIEDIIT